MSVPIGSLWICTSACDPARRAEPLARELLSARFSSPDPSPTCHLSLTTLHLIYTDQTLVRFDPNDTYIRDTQVRAMNSEIKALFNGVSMDDTWKSDPTAVYRRRRRADFAKP